MHARFDHLVIAAASLDEGVRWCEATLGATPQPGGAHPLMGTHNRLLNLSSPAFPRAYAEVIAIDPDARPTRAAGSHRWFDLDDGLLQAGLAKDGPHLVHFVARVDDAAAAVQALAHERIDRGQVVQAARETPAGLLSWQITVREDGQRLFYGALPTLIQWGPVHPTDTLAASAVQLGSLAASHPRDADLRAALGAIGFDDIAVTCGPPDLCAVIETPRGPVTLASKGL